MNARSSWSRVPAALLLVLLAFPARTAAQGRGPRDANAIGATAGAVLGVVVGLRLGETVGESADCHGLCARRVTALAVEAASVALGATAGNRGRGSFLADFAVSGLWVALFADAAGQEQYGVAALALLAQVAGAAATEVMTSPRVPVEVSVSPRGGAVEVGVTVRPAR